MNMEAKRSRPKLLPGVNSWFRSKRKRWGIYHWYCLPLLLCQVGLVVVPLALAIYLGFTSLHFLRPGTTRLIGLANYINMLDDVDFRNALLNTLLFIGIPVPLQVLAGIGLAILLRQKSKLIKGSRSLYLAPMVIPPVVVGIIWKMMLIPEMGGLDQFLSIVGIRGPDLLGSQAGARIAVIIASVWEWTPFVMLMVLAALDIMPVDPFEAAKIDGASSWQAFCYITLPLIKPVLFIAVIFRIIGSLAVFPVVYSMTGGGPGVATEPINLFAFRQGFEYFKIGYASAIGMFTFLVVLAANSYFIKRSSLIFRGKGI